MASLKDLLGGGKSETPAPAEEPVVETPVDNTPETPVEIPVETPVEEPQSVVDPATSIAQLTENKFNSIEDLYSRYQELESRPVETKEFEFPDDWSKALLETYKAGGDLTPYLRARTLDLDGMDTEQLLRMKLREDYPGVTDSQLSQLYKAEVMKKYNQDPDSFEDDEISVGKIRMEKEANEFRNAYKEKLKPYLQPEPLEEEESEKQEVPQGPTEEEMQAAFKKFEEDLRADSATTALLNAKKFEIPTVDDEVFNMDVENPDQLVEMAVSSEKFYELFNTDKGPDLSKFYKVAAFARDPDAFIKLMVSHGKELGKSKVVDDITNPSNSHSGPPQRDYEKPWEKLFSSVSK